MRLWRPWRRLRSDEETPERLIQKAEEAWKEPPTLGSLVADWGKFVTEVEDGYDLTIYDYSNDLSVRDLLEELMQRVDRETRAQAWSLIEPWDQRFQFITAAVSSPIEGAPPNSYWWWRRIPRVLNKELLSDLGAETDQGTKKGEWQREKDTGRTRFSKVR